MNQNNVCKAAKWINNDGTGEGWEVRRGAGWRRMAQDENLGNALCTVLKLPQPDPSAEIGSRPWRIDIGDPAMANASAFFLEQAARPLDHAVISVKTIGFRVIACQIAGKLGDRSVNVWCSEIRCVENCIEKLAEIIKEVNISGTAIA